LCQVRITKTAQYGWIRDFVTVEVQDGKNGAEPADAAVAIGLASLCCVESAHSSRQAKDILPQGTGNQAHLLEFEQARFLLDLSADHAVEKGEVKLTFTLTHEEIAQMIGASRETVTRLFSDFKKKQFLQVKGSTVIIKNKAGLENLAGA
jgi:CRP-like cAMP-binding protein